MPKQITPLSDIQVKNAKPQEKGKHSVNPVERKISYLQETFVPTRCVGMQFRRAAPSIPENRVAKSCDSALLDSRQLYHTLK